MGIKYFSRLLKECPSAILHIPLSTFKGKKIAIDLLGMGYNLWSIAHREMVNSLNLLKEDPQEEETCKLFYHLVRDFIEKLLSQEITPIFVIDGQDQHSKEKDKHTKEKRKKDKQARIDRVQTIKEKLKHFNPLTINSKELQELKQAHLNNSIFSRDSVSKLIELLQILGIPILKASGLTGEADKLCAFLCKSGYVSAVFTADRDVLVFGAPYIITKFAGFKYNKTTKQPEPHIEMISLNNILKETGLSYKQFVDVAILSGCDYNEKLPRYGIIKIKNLISEHGCIEALLKVGFNLAMTNYEICRKYFMHPETYKELCQEPDYNLNIDFSVMDDFSTLETGLIKFGLVGWLNRLSLHYQIMRECKIIPIKTKRGVINLKIRTNYNNSSLTTLQDWIES